MADVHELLFSLYGEMPDRGAVEAKQRAGEHSAESKNSSSRRQGEEEEEEEGAMRPEMEEKFLLFPHKAKFAAATRFPSLDNDGEPVMEVGRCDQDREPLQGPQPANYVEPATGTSNNNKSKAAVKGDPSKTLLCRLLAAHADLLVHLDVLADDFEAADTELEAHTQSLQRTLYPPEQITARSLRETYLSAMAMLAYFVTVRRLFPLASASASASASATAATAATATAAGAGARLAAHVRGFMTPTLFNRVLFSPVFFAPLLAMFAGKVLLGSPESYERWENYLKKIAYVHPDQLEALEAEKEEKR